MMLAILNSLGGGEILVILVLALIVLGPEKLPDAMRKFGNIYGELRRMSDGFQSELKDAFQDPVQEMRGTAQWMQDAVRHPMQAVADQLRDTNPAKADPGVEGDEADPDQAGIDHEAQAPVDEPDPQVADGPVPADVAAAVLPDPEPEVGPAVSAPTTTRIGELEEEDDPFSWVASHDAERDPAAADGVVNAGPAAEG